MCFFRRKNNLNKKKCTKRNHIVKLLFSFVDRRLCCFASSRRRKTKCTHSVQLKFLTTNQLILFYSVSLFFVCLFNWNSCCFVNRFSHTPPNYYIKNENKFCKYSNNILTPVDLTKSLCCTVASFLSYFPLSCVSNVFRSLSPPISILYMSVCFFYVPRSK